MRKKFMTSRFARLYLWFTNAKYTMGIFFVAYAIFYLLLGAISIGTEVALDLWTSLEMIFAGFFIGIIQQAILTVDKLSLSRSIVWIASGTLILLVFSLIFDWFGAFPAWCFAVFHICSILSMGALILGYYFQLNQETQQLNDGLKLYQGGVRQ